MPKFYGKVGYIETVETAPSVWTEQVTERNYYGDVLENRASWRDAQEKVNDDLTINNRISILADPYSVKHFSAIRYVEFYNSLWKVTSVQVQFPRLILSIGGVYNGDTAGT